MSAIRSNIDIANLFQNGCELANHFIEKFFDKTKIKYFDYQRFYKNGNYIALSSNPNFIHKFIDKELYPTLEEQNRQKETNNQVIFLSHGLSLPKGVCDKLPEKFINNILTASQYKIFHRIYYISHYKNYIEVSGFAANQDDSSIFEYYLNATDRLKKIITYFREQAESLSLLDRTKTIELPNYIKRIGHRKKYFDLSILDNEINFTKREFQCFYLYSKGQSSKSIATHLSISHRTVEKHLENIKQKTDPLMHGYAKNIFSNLQVRLSL